MPTTAAIIGLRPGGILDRAADSRARATQRTDQRRQPSGPASSSTAATASADSPPAARGAQRHRPGVRDDRAALTPGRLDLRCEGVGIEGLIGWGRPASGRVVIAASGPDAETRASGIDVAVAGAILVVGARIDVEALSRARALGVGAIVVGGIAGRDMRQLEESEARRQAALHAAAPVRDARDRWSWPDRDRGARLGPARRGGGAAGGRAAVGPDARHRRRPRAPAGRLGEAAGHRPHRER